MQKEVTMKIAITGSTGLIGSALCEHLRAKGHSILRLQRKRSSLDGESIYWKPSESVLDSDSLEGIDAAVHLAGENLFGLWTQSKKQRIMQSRIMGTALLSNAMAGLKAQPKVLISASAIGYYGHRPDAWVNEESQNGDGFLAEVCREWEKAADPAREAGIRVVHPRIGLLLSKNGGALKIMLPVFKAGLGAKLGSGNQMWSWIAIDDVIHALAFLLESKEARGPVNLVAPNPVTNKEFTKTLGKVLHRPTLFFVPTPLMEFAAGEMAQETMFSSQAVQSKRLAEWGYSFKYKELKTALSDLT
jgi:hypothetical protein